jgi:hypothetical protein
MDLGLYPSSDGQDQEKQSAGYMFWNNPDTRKPSPDQLYNLCKYFLGRTVDFDHLTASGFSQGGTIPNLDLEIDLGREERKAMARAYLEVVK